MSTSDTILLALMVLGLSIIPLLGMFLFLDRHPVVAWACEGLFIIMAGSAVTWLLLCFYLAVIF